MTDLHEILLTTAELGALLDLGARRVQQLAKQGVFVRQPGGKFALVGSVQAYLAMLRVPRGGTEAERERLRWLRARSEKAERENARERGALIAAADLKVALIDRNLRIRTRLRSIPNEFAARYIPQSKLPEAGQALLDLIDDALRDLSGLPRPLRGNGAAQPEPGTP